MRKITFNQKKKKNSTPPNELLEKLKTWHTLMMHMVKQQSLSIMNSHTLSEQHLFPTEEGNAS